MPTPTARPPERIDAGPVTLLRQSPEHAAAIATAVTRNLDHLIPWMPWAADPDGASEAAQRTRLELSDQHWEDGTEFGYVMVVATPGPEAHGGDPVELVGGCGLHRRVGPGAIEIGYWVDARHTRRGLATAVARALTEAAFAMDGIDRVEIRCDEANVASAAVPKRLGYRLDRIEDDGVQAPGECGRSMIWVLERSR